MKKNRSLIFLFSLIVFISLSGCTSKEKLAATEAYNAEVTRIEEQLAERDSVVTSAEIVIIEKELALDNALVPILESAVSNAKAIIIEITKIPNSVEEINIEIEELKKFDKSEIIQAVVEAQLNLENSIKQYKLVTVPEESFIIDRLNKVPNITGIAAVTEDNDPNGNLNKAGGYTASVYFTSSLVDQSKVSGISIIDKGTLGGGCIEVYATVDDANKRSTYLGAFDGTIFASGSHRVIGTVLIRTSDLLNGSEQKALEASIVESLTSLVE